jgi:hypothetical protein
LNTSLKSESNIYEFVLEKTSDLNESQSTGIVVFKSSPIGASVLINGAVYGKTPFSSNMIQGQYQVLFESEGYEDVL